LAESACATFLAATGADALWLALAAKAEVLVRVAIPSAMMSFLNMAATPFLGLL
jgi:hypothetical protein